MGIELTDSDLPGGTKTPAHQHVFANLRDLILFGHLAPGQAVTIQGLTDMLGAGVTPVREALRRLISEGALTQLGNRRVCVPTLTADGVEELAFMRKFIEPELARRAAARITADQLDTLEQIDAQLNEAIRLGDVGGYLTRNYQFHAAIYTLADAPIMTETVDRLWMRFGPSLRVVCGRFGTQNLPDKHADLLRGLHDRDPEAVAQAMAEDVEQGMQQIHLAILSDG